MYGGYDISPPGSPSEYPRPPGAWSPADYRSVSPLGSSRFEQPSPWGRQYRRVLHQRPSMQRFPRMHATPSQYGPRPRGYGYYNHGTGFYDAERDIFCEEYMPGGSLYQAQATYSPFHDSGWERY